MCATLFLCILLPFQTFLTVSDSKLIITNYKYTFNNNYMNVSLVFFNNSQGTYFYNATKSFLNNSILKLSVSLYRMKIGFIYFEHNHKIGWNWKRIWSHWMLPEVELTNMKIWLLLQPNTARKRTRMCLACS